MNILYVIGNGFDINVGLKTDYQSFYDYYLSEPSRSEDILKLKHHLSSERYETWADLELGLGKYSEKVASVSEFKEIYFDISDRLKEYLTKEIISFSVSPHINSVFLEDFRFPHLHLNAGMTREIGSYLRNTGGPYDINIISFNYTDIIERIILQGSSDKTFPVYIDSQSQIRSVHHVHMSLNDNDIIMGVNDESQIGNKAIINDNLKSLLVKPYINTQLQSLVDEECVDLIQKADLICLFGVSLGDTDLMWWNEIGIRMQKSSSRLIYFIYDRERATRNSDIIAKKQDARKRLLNKFGIQGFDEDLSRRIYIGYRRGIFRLDRS